MDTRMANLIRASLTAELIRKASGFVGESAEGTGKSLQTVVPLVLEALGDVASRPDGPSRLLGMVGQGAPDLLGLFSGGETTRTTLKMGGDMLPSLFGSKQDGVVTAVSSDSGVRKTAAVTLLSLAVPLVLGALREEQEARKLSATELASLVTGQPVAVPVPAKDGKPGPGAVSTPEPAAKHPALTIPWVVGRPATPEATYWHRLKDLGRRFAGMATRS